MFSWVFFRLKINYEWFSFEESDSVTIDFWWECFDEDSIETEDVIFIGERLTTESIFCWRLV